VLLDHYYAQAILALPLVMTGEVKGLVLLVDTLKKRSLTNGSKLAQALVLQAGNAIQKARLFSDLESSLEQLREAQVSWCKAARMSAMGELAAAVAHQITTL